MFGGADYVFTGRFQSDALLKQAISGMFETYAGNFGGSEIISTAINYRAGHLRSPFRYSATASKPRFSKSAPISRDGRPRLWAAE